MLVSDAEFLVKVVGSFDSNLRSFGFAGNERCNDLFDSLTQSGARIRINIHIGPLNLRAYRPATAASRSVSVFLPEAFLPAYWPRVADAVAAAVPVVPVEGPCARVANARSAAVSAAAELVRSG